MHVVITGASSGIGAALAREFAKLPGARLSLVARRESALRALARDLAVPATVILADLSDPRTAERVVADATAAHGDIDVLINNAGVQVVAPTHEVDVDLGDRSLLVNLMAPLRLTRRVLPSMLSRRAGHIVDITSMAALAPTPGMTYYNAAKAGLAAASEALRGELRGSGVHVLTVYPGIIDDTDMARAGLAAYEATPLLRLQPTATSTELARAVARAIERRVPRLVFPRVYGLTRWFPAIVRWFMDRFAPKVLPAAKAA